jgi:integrase
MISAARILSLDEIAKVVAYLKYEGTTTAWLNLTIFRLSACCGLRCKEIQGIDLCDLIHNGDYPYLELRKEIVKGEKGKRKARRVPLWWDAQTYRDLTEWQDFRTGFTDGENGPFVAALRSDYRGKRIGKPAIASHWRRTIRNVLGPDRAKVLSIHCGRHSYCSLCHAAGVSLAEIRDALGHSSLAITDVYCHALRSTIRNVFGGNP